MQLTRMQGKTVMSCQRSVANDARGVLLVLCSTMLCIHNAFICFIYILANDARGAGGVMTPGLLTSPPPFLVQGVGDDE